MTPLQLLEKTAELSQVLDIPLKDCKVLVEWARGNAQLPKRYATSWGGSAALKQLIAEHMQLTEGSLALLPYALMAKKAFGIDQDSAEKLATWLHMHGTMGEFFELGDDVIQKIFTQLDADSINLNKADGLRFAIWNVLDQLRGQFGLEESQLPPHRSKLAKLPYALVLKQQLGAPLPAAHELVDWLAGDKDWGDLDHDARDYVMNRWDDEMASFEAPASMSYEDWAMDRVADLLRANGLDPRELM